LARKVSREAQRDTVTRWHPAAQEPGQKVPISLRTCELPDEAAASAELPEPLREQLTRLSADGVLKIRSTFDPARLCARIEEEDGHAWVARATPVAGAGWSVEVRAAGAREILDLRELEAPEPLERILEAAAALEPDAALLARVPRFPRMLLPQLEQRGLAFEIFEEPDESALVFVKSVKFVKNVHPGRPE